MSTNSQEQEIDLGQIGKGISNFFQNRINGFFDFLFFIQKKFLIISILFIVGVVLAFLSDGKKYKHEISLIPNFGSNEYLYEKVDQINLKLREKDPNFFNEIGIKNYDEILSIKIEAFPAIYSFVNTRDQQNNFELIKLMAEDGNLEKIMEDEMTSKNYYHHKVTIVTKGMWSNKTLVEPILTFLNKSQFFTEQQKVYQQNLNEKIVLNDSLIKQVDKLIILLSSNNKGGSSVSISENSSIPALIDKKDKLIQETQYLRTNELIYNKIIKDENIVLNVRKYEPLYLNSKILFPVILIFLYLIGYTFIKSYKKQKERVS